MRNTDSPTSVTRRRAIGLLAGAGVGATLGATQTAWAQSYPHKAIKVVVPFTPGGTADVVVRPVTEKLSELLGHPVLAEYVAGAGGTLAAARVAGSPADGYTLLLASTGGMATGPHVTKVTYDPVKSFAPIAQLASSQYVLVVPTNSPISSLSDLLARARAKPGTLNYGTPGVGSLGHLAGELLKSMTGVQIQHVPYKGQSPMNVDLFGGRLDMAIAGLGGTAPAINAGRLRAIAVTGAARSQSMPQVPAMAELGIAGYEASVFWGLCAPAGTPADVIQKINMAARAMVQMNDVSAYWLGQGQDPVTGTPAQFGAVIQREFERWRAVVKAANISE